MLYEDKHLSDWDDYPYISTSYNTIIHVSTSSVAYLNDDILTYSISHDALGFSIS